MRVGCALRLGKDRILTFGFAVYTKPIFDVVFGVGEIVVRKIPVSCFIISKNESDRIARTIRSVRSFVDEVVVVDNESSDDTVAVALSEGCRVIRHTWLGFGGQKRFAEEQQRRPRADGRTYAFECGRPSGCQ